MRVAATILLAFLAFAADARAATVSATAGTLHVAAAPGEANQIAIAPGTGVVAVTDAGAPLAAGDGCTVSGAAIECPSAALLAVTADLGDGNDSLTSTSALPLLVADGDGADTVRGGAGADTFIASPGADAYYGGSGTDVVSYAFREQAVAVDIDNVADDGAVGEGDDVRSDIERVLGGAGSDTLIGDASSEWLYGGPGDDVLTGNGGGDRFDGTGDDVLSGGAGSDTVDYSTRTDPLAVDLGALSSIENVVGGSAGDRLTGTAAANTLVGGGGDDVLDGLAGADRLEGGAGADTVTYASRSLAVTADIDGRNDDGQTGEQDRIMTDVEHLIGGSGSDSLAGDDRPNRLIGGPGHDSLYGKGADDEIDGADGDDRAWGDAGNDRLTLGAGSDQAWGGDGADGLDGGTGSDAISGGGGDDRLLGEGGNDALGGDAGEDVLDGASGNDELNGGDGNDRLLGSADDDVLSGANGDDGLDGGDGSDRLIGGAGADSLLGESGADVLQGEAGPDRLSGGDGADAVSGGLDDDVLVGGPGGDDLSGDEGWDTVDFAGRPEPLVIDLDDQRDDGAAGEGDNVRASVEAVIGGAADDRITGSAASNYLYGESGADRLDGGEGSDRLFGGAGGDTIVGGAASDSLDGGDGADRMVARDGHREAVRCGGGRDRATTDTVDMLFGCEKRTSGTANWTSTDLGGVGRVKGVRARTGGGRFVDIPGFPGERIDRRLLADIAYLQRRYRVHITDGYARSGHAKGGEHPIGLAVDIVPGPGGSWSDVDRLARWAEPRQNRPRSPFRWVGYNGDRNHGRGHHLHLSWRHSGGRPGRPARTVWTLSLIAA